MSEYLAIPANAFDDGLEDLLANLRGESAEIIHVVL